MSLEKDMSSMAVEERGALHFDLKLMPRRFATNQDQGLKGQ